MAHTHKHLHGWSSYHYREPAPTTGDFTQAVLTMDNDWHELDISSIVPEDTKLVSVFIEIKDNNVPISFALSGTDGTSYDGCFFYTQVANQYNSGYGLIPVRTKYKLYYRAAEVMDVIKITIGGWWLS